MVFLVSSQKLEKPEGALPPPEMIATISHNRRHCSGFLVKYESIAAVLLLLLLGSCATQEQWVQEPGVTVTSGEIVTGLSNPSFVLLSVKGDRMTNDLRLENVAAYHALISLPDRSLSLKASGTTRDRATSKTRLEWKHDEGDSPIAYLEIIFDGDLKRVIIKDKIFSVVQSNLFLITVDANWEVSTIPVGSNSIGSFDPKIVLDEFKSALRDTKAVEFLSLPN